MKKFWTVAVVLLLVAVLASPSLAQKKMNLGVGGDILLPMGDFGNAYSIGFGGSARFQYNFTPMIGGGLNVGYYTWSAKSVPAGAVKPTFSGIPVRVYGKYYFMPEGAKARFYGMVELGLFFWSSKVSTPVIQTPIGPIGGGDISATGSDFNACPEVGLEFPLGSVMMDVSARYDMIFTSGSSTGNIGARVGVNFPIGN